MIKVLICDDDRDNLDILGLLLEYEGFDVIKEIDSVKLIEKIIEHNPDLLLVDIVMPTLSGEEIIGQIRSDSTLKNLPIIAFSAGYDIEKSALNAGANYFVSKPFNITQIKEAINKLVN